MIILTQGNLKIITEAYLWALSNRSNNIRSCTSLTLGDKAFLGAGLEAKNVKKKSCTVITPPFDI